MIAAILRWFGYYKIDYGFACGRHWLEIDGVTVAQQPHHDVFVPDEIVHRIGYYTIDHGRHWTRPRADRTQQ